MKWLKRILWFLLAISLIIALYTYLKLKDRHPGYWLNLNHQSNQDAPIKAGFAALSITPEVPDTWTDVDGDAQYFPEKGDTYEDGNGNGQFDPVWMAGFQNRRPAQGIHDELWARVMVLENNGFKVAWAVLDAIGYGNDEIIEIRKSIAADTDIDYVIIASTHTHEGPDLIGMWGASELSNGVNPIYRQFVIDQTTKAIKQANQGLRPAKLRFAQDLTGAKDLVEDSRKPVVLDPGLRLMQVVDAEKATTLGTMIVWANHPETTWDKNLLLSSDFCHYVRESVEKGVMNGDSMMVEGLGGITIYANGNIGGLMTTLPEFGIKDPFKDTTYTAPSFAKAQAQGERLAMLTLAALNDSTKVKEVVETTLSVKAKSIKIPLDNSLYRLAAVVGVLKRGLCDWWAMRSEVALMEIGPAQFLFHPSELYPEIAEGGIESPEGQDFALSPQEIPPLKTLMRGEFNFILGLSNDMIGYAIPKSEWDEEAPFIYDYKESPYGEINSCGPETASILHREMKALLTE